MKSIFSKEFSFNELGSIAQQLWNLHDTYHVFTFEGSLGVGKTTLVKKILHCAGVQEVITSPTFTYVNIYKNSSGMTFYHFDLYRLTSLDEFINLGFAEYLQQPTSWSFIEWPEIIQPLLNAHLSEMQVAQVKIDYSIDEKRTIVVQA